MSFGEHWEWRGFGDLAGGLRARLEALPLKFPASQELTDEYLWVPGSRINVKLRFSDLKLKRLLERTGGLERWLEDPGENHPFPVPEEIVRDLVSELGVRLPPLGAAGAPLGREALLSVLARASPPVRLVAVTKRRWQRDWLEGCVRGEEPVIVEVAEILEPERTVSVGLEHPRADRVAGARDCLGLAPALKPLSYLDALEIWGGGGRITGRP